MNRSPVRIALLAFLLLSSMLLRGAAGQKPQGGNPFPHQIDIPKLPDGLTWANTSGPLKMSDLRGKFVLFDFWTYCCINCIHVLPELKKLEETFADELVVIGVHSAKFETERDIKNIEEAILRYEIEHPVINDNEHKIWNMFRVRSWPTILLIDPQGKAVYMKPGEFTAEQLTPILKAGIQHYKKLGVLDTTPIRFDLLAHRATQTPLRFPGKVLADEAGKRLFISDSNHNRIVVTTLDGELLDIIGTGEVGKEDGRFDKASFNHPQGMALHKNVLFVADTENHMIREVDLRAKQVRTISGDGTQRRTQTSFAGRRSGRLKPKRTALNSPWALWVHERFLYIAMAGPHQIWWMPLSKAWIGPYAGNGREDIVDGPRLPNEPYGLGASSFAQPSGLTSDGEILFVADSEGSSIRSVPLDPKSEVKTLIGTANLEQNRLFVFGDVDGPAEQALLQHPLGVTYHDGIVYVADTYNNKIKTVDSNTGAVRTIAGEKEPGNSDKPARFDEPAGISYCDGKLYVADANNHAIRVVDLENGNRVSTLKINGLKPPVIRKRVTVRPEIEETVEADRVSIKPTAGAIRVDVDLTFPDGFKLNELAPIYYSIHEKRSNLISDETRDQRLKAAVESNQVSLQIPVQSDGDLLCEVDVEFFYCKTGLEALCKLGQLRLLIDAVVDESATESRIELTHRYKSASD